MRHSHHYNSKIDAWYQHHHGKWLTELEQHYLRQILKRSFGDYSVQIGGPENFSEDAYSFYHYNYYLTTHIIQHSVRHTHSVLAPLDDLPFLPNSLDLVILVHALETTEHPTLVLKEIYDALKPNGQLILFSFNPWSIWGLQRYFRKQDNFPWLSHFPARRKVLHWLNILGLTIQHNKTLSFYPPVKQLPNSRLTLLTEMLGQFFFPPFGGVYAICAKKEMHEPIKKITRWQTKLASHLN